ncbi:MAG TPA: 50S ribosomal protein L32e [Nitrososphaerales archaeon]|nr:50S ribosomal protein L32e [Nitrososphaerales archaeon]
MSAQESNSSKKGGLESSSRAPTRASVANLLELRRQIKSKTPNFRRFESWRYVRIHEEWRKPKGVDNHMRLSVKGWPHLVKVGYRVPKEVRYLHPSGYRDVLVHNVAELEKLSPDRDAARLAAGVGKRKRIEIALRARELGIRILNGRNLLTAAGAKEEKEKGKEEEPKPSNAKTSQGKKAKRKDEGRKK